MRVLITGGSGLLGQYLNVELSKKYQISSIYNSNAGNCTIYNSVQANISDFSLVEDVFQEFLPDVVVHTAAVSRNELVNQMSSETVYAINVSATENIARLCSKYKSKMIYTSTDLVYDGDYSKMLKEDAPLKPISLYAETKLLGENAIKNTFDNFIILRTALLYGIGLNHTSNHFQNMYQNLLQKKEVKLFYDQFRTPLSLKDASRIITDFIEKDISGEVINFGGRDRLSRYEMGELLCDFAGLNKDFLIPTPMYDAKNLPPVADVSMNTDKLQECGITQNSFESCVFEIIKDKVN